MNRFIIFILAAFLFTSCSVTKKASRPATVHSLTMLNYVEVPFAKKFMNTTVGGLSGIDYDKKNDQYYLICDDRSEINPARFYTAKIIITNDKIDSVMFTDTKPLLQPNGNAYPNNKQDAQHVADPEAVRWNAATEELTWTSEGERIIGKDKNVIIDPSIINIGTDGRFHSAYELPYNFRMQTTEKGPRRNGVFEGLTYSGNYKFLYVNVEEPLYDDGQRAGLNDTTGWIRIAKFDAVSKKQVAQYAYQIDAVAHPATPPDAFKINGVPDILWLSDTKLLVMERSFSTGRAACTIKIYIADLSKADNIESVAAIPGANIKPATKKLLLNLDDLGVYTDNIEGMTFGPVLSNGHRSLILVSDNNFSPAEKTQFFLFEVK